jgi:hypothetical protein
VEGAVVQGYRYPDTSLSAVYLGTTSTGTTDAIDNASAVGYEIVTARDESWIAPFWEASASGWSTANTIEILTLGNLT